MADRLKNIDLKIFLIYGLLCAVFAAVLIQIVRIQFFQGDHYRSLAEKQTIRLDSIQGSRGNVLSREGDLLATSMMEYSLFFDYGAVDAEVFDENLDALSDSLAAFGEYGASYYRSRFLKAKATNNRYLSIARNLRYSEYERVRSFPVFNLGRYSGGLIVNRKQVRARPIGEVAARTVGYSYDRGGVGIEGFYNAYLKGKDGWRWEQKIDKHRWKPVGDASQEEPENGKDIVSTLSVPIQDIAHNALLKQLIAFEADHGCAVVMDVKTGEILAMSNLGLGKDGAYFEKRNYAVWESQEPGSTFKLASLMVALEDERIDTAQVIDTEGGQIKVYGRSVRDSRRGGFGEVSVARSIELSSNVAMVKMIQEAYGDNPKDFIEGLDRLGLNRQTGIGIKGEGRPYYPRVEDDNWNGLSLPWMSWGYGVQLTPLQILTFYNGIANDGKVVKPRLIKEIRDDSKVYEEFETEVLINKMASSSTIDQVQAILADVVKKGTAENIYDENFSMSGKTGTCQTEYWLGKREYISSFVGFFPSEEPRYSCIVVVNKPNRFKGYYGATVAAPIFKEIAKKIYTSTPRIEPLDEELIDDLRAKESSFAIGAKGSSKADGLMPDVKGMVVSDAVPLLENLGYKVLVRGDVLGVVKTQSESAGKKVVEGKKIVISA